MPPFAWRMPDDPERDPADRDVGADGVRVEAEVVGGGRAEDGHAERRCSTLASVRNEPCQIV